MTERVNSQVRPGIDGESAGEQRALASSAGDLNEAASAERGQRIMEERGRALARAPSPAPAAGEMLDIVTFRLAGERYGIEARYVREVIRPADLAVVPGTPDYLAGVTNLRGDILAVFNLGRLFGLAVQERTLAVRIIVLGYDMAEFGILTDSVEDAVVMRSDELLEPPASVSGIDRDSLLGVTTGAQVVLNGAALLQDERFFIDQPENIA